MLIIYSFLYSYLGSMYVHMFGAWFGIALTLIVSKKSSLKSQNLGESYYSNLMSMIGTIFL